MTYERYSKIRNEHNYKDAQICKMTGIAPATISDWKHGKSSPKEDKLRLIAKALDIPFSDFIDEVIAPEQFMSGFELTFDEEKLIEAYRNASDEEKRMLVEMAAFFKSKKTD